MMRWMKGRKLGWRVVVGLSAFAVIARLWSADPIQAGEGRTHSDAEEAGAPADHADGAEGIRLSEEAKRNIGLTVEAAAPRTIQKVISVNGVVKPQPNRLAAVGPKTEAIVERALVNPWDRVKKGQLLAELRSRQFGNPPPLISLTAPIAGVISKWDAKVGEAVGPGSVLFEIVDPSVVWVEGDIPEQDAHLVSVGQAARVSMIALPDEIFTGRIVRMGGMVEPDKRTIHVWVEVANPAYQLKPEMFAQLAIVVGSRSQALAVPKRALLRFGGESIVFIEQEGAYLRRNVVVGAQDDRYTEIARGLRPGELVVTQGNYELMSSIFIKGGVEEHGH
ncbi:MAG: efflux RND transporter periplasmic adaptor subunit [Nitrospirae bacterium]|nr:efflux RND transporter periplasmic adaptor subunit [Nitrospirota bacterium]